MVKRWMRITPIVAVAAGCRAAPLTPAATLPLPNLAPPAVGAQAEGIATTLFATSGAIALLAMCIGGMLALMFIIRLARQMSNGTVRIPPPGTN